MSEQRVYVSCSPQVPSVFTGGEKKFSNKHQEKFEDKIPSIVSVLKSNSSESNKLYSLKSGKKLSSLPNLKIPVYAKLLIPNCLDCAFSH